jgi:hypothetical protein
VWLTGVGRHRPSFVAGNTDIDCLLVHPP